MENDYISLAEIENHGIAAIEIVGKLKELVPQISWKSRSCAIGAPGNVQNSCGGFAGF